MVLGLLGGGGSILIVPILVYLMKISPILATTYSLFIVALASSIATIANYKNQYVQVKLAFIFAIPSLIAVYLVRRYLIPNLPDILFTFQGLSLTKDSGIMILFAFMLLISGFSMLKNRSMQGTSSYNTKNISYNYSFITIQGAVVGTFTGILGAGGGFLIVPTLVTVMKLPMKLAVGTSLMIITLKSSLGFIGDIQANQNIDWSFLLMFSGLTIVGIFIGLYTSNFLSNKVLKRYFAWLTILIGIIIFFKEFI